MAKINVVDTDITAVQENNEGCFCLTGMLKAKKVIFSLPIGLEITIQWST